MKVAHFKHRAAFLTDVLFIPIHCRLFVTIIGGVVFSHFLCFPFFCVNVSAFIETHSVFVCALSLPPSPSSVPSPPHTDEQPVKVKRKKSFNLSRKFPFYKSKENIVQELVESEREYPLCDQRGVVGVTSSFGSPFSPCFRSLYHLSSFHSRDVWSDGITLIPASVSQREAPHVAGDVGLLCGVSVCLSVGSRGASSCVCERLAVLT